ncbi:YciI family protein [Variovorax sp. RT4R15]|uniref:YciI family protein n=1 Tax=Variovorax sp. RT4R15 TaxID=3443737 RepID=UPI003F46DA99
MGIRHFVIFATDRPGAESLRQENRERHRAYIRQPDGNGVVAVLGGATLDEAGLMNGSMLVVAAEDKVAARAFFASDPYVVGGLFAEVIVREWRWGLGRCESCQV